MTTYEIRTKVEEGDTYVLIQDEELRELAKLEALSSKHAQQLAVDCALIAAKRPESVVVLCNKSGRSRPEDAEERSPDAPRAPARSHHR